MDVIEQLRGEEVSGEFLIGGGDAPEVVEPATLSEGFSLAIEIATFRLFFAVAISKRLRAPQICQIGKIERMLFTNLR
jgi:hypothetical protein